METKNLSMVSPGDINEWTGAFKDLGLWYNKEDWQYGEVYEPADPDDANLYNSRGEVIFNPITAAGGGDSA